MDMNTIILAFIYLIGITLLLVVNEMGYRKLKIKGEVSRKIAHVVSTLSVLPFPYLFPSHWYVLVMAFIFFLVLFITQYKTQLKSIHDIDRKSIGSYLLPLSIYITFLIAEHFNSKLIFILPMLILAISDPVAAIVGLSLKKYNHRIRIFGMDTGKSMFGSGAFFLSSFVLCLLAYCYSRGVCDVVALSLSLIVAFASTLGELFSWHGSDNLSVPLSVILVLLTFN